MNNIKWLYFLYRLLTKNKYLIGFISLFVSKKKAKKLKKNIIELDIPFLYKLIKNYKNFSIIYPPPGFGEIFVVGTYMKAYREQVSDKKVLFLSNKKGHAMYIKNIIKEVDEVLMVPNGYNKVLNVINFDIYKNAKRNGGYNYPTMKQGLITAMGIDENSETHYMEIKPSPEIKKLFEEKGFEKNKVVFINTKSVTLQYQFKDEFWIDIANKLISLGYKVVFNSNEKDFHGFDALFLSPKEVLEFVSLCGNFLSVRTGLADVIVGTLNNIKSYVIYPANEHLYSGQTVLDFFSLKHMSKGKTFKEVIYSKDLELDKEICQYFSK